MKATGYRGGSQGNTGAGYGIRISKADRDAHFQHEWRSVTLKIKGNEIRVRLTPSFWQNCTELRSRDVGDYMLRARLAPWPDGRTPKFELVPEGEGVFKLERGRG